MNTTLGPDDTQVARMRAVVLTEIASQSRTNRRRHFFTVGTIALVAVLGTTAAAIIVAQA
ncbi:hypothetical protein [Diaminobutyricibacter sp. McL0608]|uniref:hypothetical protein n=1 Tax=Leifsonia sp. McL0608 TaxID=3143537 RepID=UPI0031F31DE3